MKKNKYAYIFDFDGVLVNTMPAHFECYKKALDEVGVSIDEKQFYSQAGMTGVEQINYFINKTDKTIDAEKVYVRKKVIWSENKPTVSEIECNLLWLKMLREQGYSVAIASGSSKGSILPIMKQHNIEVDTVVSQEDVERGKPFPDLFLAAAERLSAKAEDCIVIEDSDAGIEAAIAAGMKVMRFYDNSVG